MSIISSDLILFEDEHLIVLEKPAALHSVIQEKSASKSVAQALIDYNSNFVDASPNKNDAGLVQRLDFDSSGCILAAKNQLVWNTLFEMLKAGSIKKKYRILVEGNMPDQDFESYLGGRYRRSKKVTVYLDNTSSESRLLQAETHFKHLCYNQVAQVSLMQVEVARARRHQIRAHAAHLSYPLVGDSLYGAKLSLSELSSIANFGGRQYYLHASSMEFVHPVTSSLISVRSGLVFENFV